MATNFVVGVLAQQDLEIQKCTNISLQFYIMSTAQEILFLDIIFRLLKILEVRKYKRSSSSSFFWQKTLASFQWKHDE
jgi:hypothetical protein